MTHDKKADLSGPGIGNYEDLAKVLAADYHSLLNPRETQEALFAAKRYVVEGLCRELNLMMVQVPLIVDAESGVNDMLDRDGSRTPVGFHISNDHGKHPIDAQVVQAATKWKRVALAQFGLDVGEGICTDMKAVRKDYFIYGIGWKRPVAHLHGVAQEGASGRGERDGVAAGVEGPLPRAEYSRVGVRAL